MHEVVLQLNYPGKFLGRKNHAQGEVLIFMHENLISIIHENKTFSCHDFFMHETFFTGCELLND